MAGGLQALTTFVANWVVDAGSAYLNDRLHFWDGNQDPDMDDYDRQRRRCANGQWSGSSIRYFDLDDDYWRSDPSINDQRGRATGAEACLQGRIPPGGTPATYYPPGYRENEGMASGHLIARSLGGSGQHPGNLVPLYQHKVNSSAMYHGIEKTVRSLVASGEVVYYRVEPHYVGADPMPDYLRVIVSTDHGTLVARIDNRR